MRCNNTKQPDPYFGRFCPFRWTAGQKYIPKLQPSETEPVQIDLSTLLFSWRAQTSEKCRENILIWNVYVLSLPLVWITSRTLQDSWNLADALIKDLVPVWEVFIPSVGQLVLNTDAMNKLAYQNVGPKEWLFCFCFLEHRLPEALESSISPHDLVFWGPMFVHNWTARSQNCFGFFVRYYESTFSGLRCLHN